MWMSVDFPAQGRELWQKLRHNRFDWVWIEYVFEICIFCQYFAANTGLHAGVLGSVCCYWRRPALSPLSCLLALWGCTQARWGLACGGWGAATPTYSIEGIQTSDDAWAQVVALLWQLCFIFRIMLSCSILFGDLVTAYYWAVTVTVEKYLTYNVAYNGQ